MREPIPLAEAYLCSDCNRVGDQPGLCQCGSGHLLALQTVLDRQPADGTSQVDRIIRRLDEILTEVTRD